MAIKPKEMRKIRKALQGCKRPLVFFDDDCDGLTSFLQIFQFVGDGKGVCVKNSPELGEQYVRRVEEYQPDLIVVVDKPMISQDFLDNVKQRVIWIDHHGPQDRKGVEYYNPRLNDDSDNRPTSYWVYKILKKSLWLAMVGTIADWHYPEDIVKKFKRKYPGYLPKEITTAPAAIHESKLGDLIRVISFNLKGNITDTMTSVRTLSRIKEPSEIMEQTTPKGKFIYKKYSKMIEQYQGLLDAVKVTDEKVVVFTYSNNSYSFTSDLSNEILYRHPDKVGIICREDQSEMKCSIRSTKTDISKILKDSLENLNGSGGGHTNACGCRIVVEDFDKLVQSFKDKL
ncbi:DHHA1 domain-containing protein [Nanoarchaeota archaeon]